MIEPDFEVPRLVDYIATSIWATSGSIVGIQKQFDVVGVFVKQRGRVTAASVVQHLPSL